MKKMKILTFMAIFWPFSGHFVACYPQDPAIECYSIEQWDSLKSSQAAEILALRAENNRKLDSVRNYMNDTIVFIKVWESAKMQDTVQKVWQLLDEVSRQIEIQGNGTATIKNDSSYFRLTRQDKYFNLIFAKKEAGKLDERLHLTVSDGSLELWEGKENVANLVYFCKLIDFSDY